MTATYTYPQALDLLAGVRTLATRKDPTPEQAFLIFCFQHAIGSHAQFFQDLWILHETKNQRDGYFVEFGGADGVRSSNTLLLERRFGWTGIVAEPARIWYPAIRNNRTCAVDDRCVWVRSGDRIGFTQPAIALHSTIDHYADGDQLADTRTDGLRYEVETVSLNDLLDHWNAPPTIDYLSIDTEGSELDILSHFDFDRWDVRRISVEHNHTPQRQALYELLTARGYRRVLEKLSNVDDWYVKAD